MLDPSSGFDEYQELTAEDVGRLVAACVARLTAADSVSLATVKMQVFFDQTYAVRGETCVPPLLPGVASYVCTCVCACVSEEGR